jgi:hypothetical protein
MFIKHTVLAAALLVAGTANAEVGATADLGTTGAGFHLVVPVTTGLNGRFGANYLHHSFSRTTDNVDYELKGKLQTFDALLDWYPLEGGSFRLTGGAIYNGNKFDARGKPNGTGTFTLNGNIYSATDVGILDGRIDFRKAAPYLGIGWGNALAQSSRWHVNADLGLFYQGSPNVELANVGCAASAVVCNQIAQDVAAERARLRDDSESFKFYPVLRVGIGYRF